MSVKPLPIVWIGRPQPQVTEDLVRDVSRSLHLKPNQTALLLFYCHHMQGFCPSEAMIAEAIGCTGRWVRKLRQQLADRGVIGVDDYAVYIDWNRLRQYAMLDPVMTLGRATALPIPTRTIRTRDALRYLTCSIPEAVAILGSLSAEGAMRLLRDAQHVPEYVEELELPPSPQNEEEIAAFIQLAIDHKADWIADDPLPF